MKSHQAEDYSRDEIDEIFRLALKRQVADHQRASREELLDVARTMGIDPELVDEAVAQYEQDGRKARARAVWLRRKRAEFRETARSFCIIMPILLAVNFFMGGGWWVHWPALGWGIILFIEAGEAYWPSEKDLDQGANKLLKKAMYSGKRIEEI